MPELVFVTRVDDHGKVIEHTRKIAKSMDDMQRRADGAADGAGKLSSAWGKVSDAVGMVGVGGGLLTLGGIVQGLVASTMDFERAWSKVNVILRDLPKDRIDSLKASVQGMEPALGSTTELAEGLYQTISSGVTDPVKAMEVLRQSAIAAKGGFVDVGATVQAGTTLMAAFGVKAEDMRRVFDKMAKTVDLGKLEFKDLAAGIGGVASIASTTGMSMDELFASVATLSLTKPAAQAMTEMKAVLSNIVTPSKQAADMAESLGINFGASAIKSKGFTAVLEEIAVKTGGSAEKLGILFGSTEAFGAVAQLTAEGGLESFKDGVDGISKSVDGAGASMDSFRKAMEGMGAKWETLKNQASNLAAVLGEKIAPTAAAALDSISGMVSQMASGEMPINTFTTAVMAFGAAIATVKFIALVDGLAAFVATAPAGVSAFAALTASAAALNVAAGLAAGGLVFLGVRINQFLEDTDKINEAKGNLMRSNEVVEQNVKRTVEAFKAQGMAIRDMAKGESFAQYQQYLQQTWKLHNAIVGPIALTTDTAKAQIPVVNEVAEAWKKLRLEMDAAMDSDASKGIFDDPLLKMSAANIEANKRMLARKVGLVGAPIGTTLEGELSAGQLPAELLAKDMVRGNIAAIAESFRESQIGAARTAEAVKLLLSQGADAAEVYKQFGGTLEEYPGLFDAATRAAMEHGEQVLQLKAFWTGIKDTIKTGLAGAFSDALSGARKFSDGLKSIWASIKKQFFDFIGQTLVTGLGKLFSGLAGAFRGAGASAGSGGFAGIGAMLGGLFGGGGSGSGGGGILGGLFGGGGSGIGGGGGISGGLFGGGGGLGGLLGGLFGRGNGGGGNSDIFDMGGGLSGGGVAPGGLGSRLWNGIGGWGGVGNLGAMGAMLGGQALGGMDTWGGRTLTFTGLGASIGGMIAPGIGHAIGAGIGALAGLISGLWKNPYQSGSKEVGRDFGGVGVGYKDVESFATSLGLGKSKYEGIRKDLLSSPKFLTEIAYQQAKQQGKLEEFLKSLESVQTVMGAGNFRAGFEAWMKTGDATALNKSYSDLFSQSEALQANLPNWKDVLLASGATAGGAATGRVRLNAPINANPPGPAPSPVKPTSGPGGWGSWPPIPMPLPQAALDMGLDSQVDGLGGLLPLAGMLRSEVGSIDLDMGLDSQVDGLGGLLPLAGMLRSEVGSIALDMGLGSQVDGLGDAMAGARALKSSIDSLRIPVGMPGLMAGEDGLASLRGHPIPPMADPTPNAGGFAKFDRRDVDRGRMGAGAPHDARPPAAQPPAKADPQPPLLGVPQQVVNFAPNIIAIDGQDAERAMREKLWPAFLEMLKNNTANARVQIRQYT